MTAAALFRPTFTDLRSEVERMVANGSAAEEIDGLVQQFLAAGGDTPAPIVEYDGTVTWIYRNSQAQEVSVVGDIIGFDPRTTRMARIAGTDLFYMSAQLPIDAQIAYAFVVDNPLPASDDPQALESWLARCQPDPLNPRQIVEPAPLRTVSVLMMPGAQALDLPEHDPHGVAAVSMHVVGSADLGAWRRVWVSLPYHYDPSQSYPTLYCIEGEGYMLSARAHEIAGTLGELQEIEAPVMVFLDASVERGVEWLGRMFDAVVPFIEARYAVRSDPAARVVCGASAGGAASLALALTRPELFGGAVLQSPAPDLAPPVAAALLAKSAARSVTPPRCYIDVGRYEVQASIEYVHELSAALIEGGAALAYQEFSGDHSFLGWRTTFPDALRFHFGASPLGELE
jgi:enterochelin esterase-like enzyme